jgi:hypothetical protein
MAQSIQAVRIAAAGAVISMIAAWGSSAIAAEATPQKAVEARAVLPTMVVTAPAISRLPTAIVTARAYQRLPVAMVTAPATGLAANTQLAARF